LLGKHGCGVLSVGTVEAEAGSQWGADAEGLKQNKQLTLKAEAKPIKPNK